MLLNRFHYANLLISVTVAGLFFHFTDLSFQAAARIMSVPKFDSLKLMRELSQNFPSMAR